MKRLSMQKGFTLPELLIALLIFSMISGAGVYALRLAVEAREQLDEADSVARAVQLTRLVIKEDLFALVPRTVRDEFGNAAPAAFVGGDGFVLGASTEGEELLIGFVRRGWSNPGDEAPRSTLQYVEYLAIDDRLVRRSRPYLDAARDQPVADRTLLTGVSNLTVSFVSGESNAGLIWSDIWPVLQNTGFAPRAVRLRLKAPRLGDLEQLFWIGEGGGNLENQP